MKARAAAVSFLVAGAALQDPAAAQSADTLRLTLEAAVEIARGDNPGYRQAVNAAALNTIEWRTVWFDQVLPQVSLNVFGTSYYGNIRRRAQDNFGNPIANPSADWVYFSETNQALGLDWNIQGRSVLNAIDRERLAGEQRTLGQARAATELEIGVERAFWDALEQRELRAAEEELLAAREVDLRVAERLFGLAMRSRVDVLRSELAVEQQRFTLGHQTAAAERAALALRTHLGGDELGEIAVVPTELPIFNPTGLDVATLLDRATSANVGLRQAAAAVESARVEARDANRLWWPTLSLNYTLSRRAQTPQSRALFDFTFDEPLDHRFFIGLQVPMFSSYLQNRRAIAQRSVALRNETEAERDARLRVEESVRGALLELRNQWEALRVSERSGQIAGQALELAREEYRVGTRTFEALRQSVDDEALTRRQLIQARYVFVDALLDLEEAVGTRVRN